MSTVSLATAPTPRPGAVRVLVVDDSAIVRGLVSRQLQTDPDIAVVATAAHGEAALMELGRRDVDVVVLDIEMPVMDGLTVLPLIVERYPRVKVIMASTLTRRNAEISLRALQLGACDYVPKPESNLVTAEDFQRDLIQKVKTFGGRASPTAAASPAAIAAAPAASPQIVRRPALQTPSALAIAASTGGPPALLKLFEALRGAVKQPIFVVQHMPPTFTALLAERLSVTGDRPCAEARDGEVVTPGRCYVAPGGWHMTVSRGVQELPKVRLNQEPPENFCRPAVDPTFRSLAEAYGPGVMAVVLTGMGSDGAKGCQSIAAAGGRFAVQDEPSSVVWGMPGAAAGTGLAEAILPLDEIAGWLRRVMSPPA